MKGTFIVTKKKILPSRKELGHRALGGSQIQGKQYSMAAPEGLEPPTLSSED